MSELEQLKADVEILKKHAHVHKSVIHHYSNGITEIEHGPPDQIFVKPKEEVPCDYLYALTVGGVDHVSCNAAIEKIIKAKARTDPHDTWALHAAIEIMGEINRLPRKYLGTKIDELEKELNEALRSEQSEVMELHERLRQSESARDCGDKAIEELIAQRDHAESQLASTNDENLKFRKALRAIGSHTTVCSDFVRAEDCQKLAKEALKPN